MESPSSLSYSDSCSSNDLTFESSEESFNEDFSFGYFGEPEYNETEFRLMNFSSSSQDSKDSESELNSSRLENLHWCQCQQCTVMPTFFESRCCKEFSILGQKLQDASCITLHKDFDVLLLHKSILEAAFIKHRRFKKNFTEVTNMTNKNYRFMAYSQYSAWVHYYELLGRGNRIVIPACVISRIRGEFPSFDNKYTGFKEFTDLEL